MNEQDSRAARIPPVGLVLPGGGARGAYQIGVLKAIAEIVPDGRNPFPILSGVSVGAINATSLASRATNFAHAVEHLVKLWGGLHASDIYKTDFGTIALTGAHWFAALTLGGLGIANPRALLNNAPLGELLRRELPIERIDDAIADGALEAVAVSASSYATGRAVSFFQGGKALKEWVRSRRDGVRTALSVEHLLGSAALPYLFPAQAVGSDYFGDGSLRLTAPLSPAIRLGASKLLVIGVRDESVNRAPAETARPPYPNLGALAGYLLDVIFSDNLDADIERLRRVNATLALLSPEQRSATPLRQVEAYVIRPSRDIRDIAQDHAHEVPWTIRMLIRGLGGWRAGGQLPSFLLFEPGFCKALIELGYTDAMEQREQLSDFLEFGGSPAPTETAAETETAQSGTSAAS